MSSVDGGSCQLRLDQHSNQFDRGVPKHPAFASLYDLFRGSCVFDHAGSMIEETNHCWGVVARMLQLGLVLSTGLVHCKHLTLHWYGVLYRASQGLMISLPPRVGDIHRSASFQGHYGASVVGGDYVHGHFCWGAETD